MAVTTCIVSAQDAGSTDSASDSGSTDDGSSTDDSGSDSVEDSSSDDAGSDDSAEDTTDDSGIEESTDESSDESSSDSTDESSGEETEVKSGDIYVEAESNDAEEDSNNADDGSTIVEVEETNTEITNTEEETNIEDTNAEEVIISGGPVVYKEENTEINDIDNIDYSSEYSSNETTILENSTIDNSNKYIDNSTTIVNKTEITDIDIDNSKNTNLSITNNSVVNNINFVSKESGKTKVIVKEVYEKPPVENVYKTFNIFVDNAEVANNMENAAVDFKVEKTWLIENNLDASVIVLNMYEGDKWIEVPATITGEDSQFVYFKAKVSKYSTFAISSKATTVDKVLKQTGDSDSIENMDGPTKSVIVKMLEFVIELIEGS